MTEFGSLCTTQLLKTLFSGHPLEIARCCLIAVNVFNLGCPIFGVYCANQYKRELISQLRSLGYEIFVYVYISAIRCLKGMLLFSNHFWPSASTQQPSPLFFLLIILPREMICLEGGHQRIPHKVCMPSTCG